MAQHKIISIFVYFKQVYLKKKSSQRNLIELIVLNLEEE